MTTFTGAISSITAGTTSLSGPVNNHRDALKALSESWTAYGTGASWTASSSNPSIGDGTWAGAYMQVDKLVMFRATITMGASTTYGTGTWRVALPVAAKASVRWQFQAEGVDAGVNAYSLFGVTDNAATYCSLFRSGNPVAAVTSALPHTWGSTDVLTVQGAYEAA